MKAMVLGAGGQVGRKLAASVPPGVQLTAADRAQVDVTDERAVQHAIASLRPDVVLNAAAYTAVDLAEGEQQRAHAVNAAAVATLARVCHAQHARLIHVSTDFVFDGTKGIPYKPSDPPNPLGVYAASKLAGERAIQEQSGLSWRIVRTAWVYASTGRNFMLTMLRLFSERDEVRVVSDQVGTPTSVHSLAECLWRAATDSGESAILHFTDAGVASWYDFAQATYEEAHALGILRRQVRVTPIATRQYPTPARRPSYSVLDTQGSLERLGLAPVHWRQRLRETLEELQESIA